MEKLTESTVSNTVSLNYNTESHEFRNNDVCNTDTCENKCENRRELNNNNHNVNNNNVRKTFADATKNELNEIINKLSLIPIEIEEGREVVVLDEELVREGSMKWMFTLCGDFVGCKMSYYELKYNLGKMWGKYGLKDIVVQNGLYLFKFRETEGMNQVLESGHGW